MKIRRDLFRVATGARDDGGHKMDAEEQPTARVVVSEAPATLGGGPQVGSLPMEVVAYSTAGDVGLAKSSMCVNCKYFDRTWWLRTVRDAERGTHEERESINAIRAEVLTHGMADLEDDDVEEAIRVFGKCHAMSEHQKDLVVVHPEGSCPSDVRSASMPNGFFKPRDTDAAKFGTAARDHLLHTAEGKI